MAFSFARSSGRIGDVARRGGRRIHGKYAFPFNAFRPDLHRASIRAPYEVQGYRPVHRKRSDHGFKGNTPTQGRQGSGTEDRVVRKPKHLYKAAYVPPALLQQDVKDMYATLLPFLLRRLFCSGMQKAYFSTLCLQWLWDSELQAGYKVLLPRTDSRERLPRIAVRIPQGDQQNSP